MRTVVSLPSSAAITLLGSVAAQTHVPAKLATCNVSVDGGGFAPNVAFAPQSNPVARYTVTLAFFDRKNVSVGRVDVTDHGADVYDLPAHSDSMTCAISRLTLDDGTVFPASGAGNASLGGIALGVIGVGAIVGIAIGASHRSSNSSAVATAAPTVTPTTGSGGVTATPTSVATGSTAAPTPTPTPTGIATTYPRDALAVSNGYDYSRSDVASDDHRPLA